MYTIDKLKKVKCTYMLVVTFKARALLEQPTLVLDHKHYGSNIALTVALLKI